MQLTRLIFLEKDKLWFGIYNPYAIKRIMQLTEFVCNFHNSVIYKVVFLHRLL